MKFYKYPECEPLKAAVYLCVVYISRYAKGNRYFFEYKEYNGNHFFKKYGEEIVAFTNLTAEEAAQNAEI